METTPTKPPTALGNQKKHSQTRNTLGPSPHKLSARRGNPSAPHGSSEPQLRKDIPQDTNGLRTFEGIIRKRDPLRPSPPHSLHETEIYLRHQRTPDPCGNLYHTRKGSKQTEFPNENTPDEPHPHLTPALRETENNPPATPRTTHSLWNSIRR